MISNRKKGSTVPALLIALALTPALALAGPITITSYDIQNAAVSGCGGWGHSYDGTITNTASPLGCRIANYSGGSGTLNDGVFATSESFTQLFLQASGPIITLHFSGMVTLNTLDIYGGAVPGNYLPGGLSGATFSFGGASVTIGSTAFGPNMGNGPVNDSFSFAGTSLDGAVGNTLSISNVTGPLTNDSFSITEIALDGEAASAVPEPATFLFFGTGLTLLAVFRRRRHAR